MFRPNSNTYPGIQYLSLLLVSTVEKLYDLSKLVFRWLMAYIPKYRREASNESSDGGFTTLGECIYGLGVSLFFFYLM